MRPRRQQTFASKMGKRKSEREREKQRKRQLEYRLKKTEERLVAEREAVQRLKDEVSGTRGTLEGRSTCISEGQHAPASGSSLPSAEHEGEPHQAQAFSVTTDPSRQAPSSDVGAINNGAEPAPGPGAIERTKAVDTRGVLAHTATTNCTRPRSRVVVWTKTHKALRVWGRRGRAFLADSPPVIIINRTRKSPEREEGKENEKENGALPCGLTLYSGPGSLARALEEAQLRMKRVQRPCTKRRREGASPTVKRLIKKDRKKTRLHVPDIEPQETEGRRRYAVWKLKNENTHKLC